MLVLRVAYRLVDSLAPAQNTVVDEVQQLPWRLCYARDKAQPAPTAAASAGADALQVMPIRTPCNTMFPAVSTCTSAVVDRMTFG